MVSSLSLASALAASALISAIWQGVLLAVVVALCLRLLPPVSAAVRSILWFAVFSLATLLHFAPLLCSGSAAASALPAHALHADPRWSLLLAAVWLTLSLIRAWQLTLSALHLRRIARNSTPVVLPGNLRLPRCAVLCTSTEVDRPSVAGFFGPRILLPPSLLAALTAAELEQVLLHETEHLRRGDDWTNLLQKLALVLFPLNPVLLWVERRLCLERELACDDHVLRATAAPKAYARCLTSLAEHTALERTLTLALGAWQRQSELARRVLRILGTPTRTLARTQAGLLSGALIAGLLGASLQLAHTPEVISFLPALQPLPALAANTPPSAGFFYAGFNRSRNTAHEVLTRAELPATRSPLAQPRRRPVVARVQPRVAREQSRPRLVATTLHRSPLRAEPLGWSLTIARLEASAALAPLTVSSPQAQPFLPAPNAQTTKFTSDTQPATMQIVRYAAVPFANGWLIIKL